MPPQWVMTVTVVDPVLQANLQRFKAISSTQAIVAREPQIRNRSWVTLYSPGVALPRRERGETRADVGQRLLPMWMEVMAVD